MSKIPSNVDRQRSYINNVPIRQGEVTIVTSESAEASMVHSCRFGDSTAKAGVSTLILNCAMSDKRFKEYFHANHKWQNSTPQLLFKSSVRGNLVGDAEAIEQLCSESHIGMVIILGWEWTSSGSRRKERLLHFLRSLMEDYNIAVVVYSHCYNAPKPGHIDKGGVGKLALLAMFVAEITASDELEKACPKPKPMSFSMKDVQDAEESARLLIRKINELGDSPVRIVSSGEPYKDTADDEEAVEV